jgi:hypothetical protein
VSTAAVAISRLTVNGTVPRDHPNLARVQRRLDEVAGGPLREALAEVLAPLARSDSDEVVIIRRLEVDLDLSIDLAGGASVAVEARRWAARLARQIARALDERGPTAMLRFPTEAHFLARFLIDAAAGRAHGKWYYRRYRGLEPLAVAAALRTAILEQPRRGIDALATLEPAELGPLLRVLGAREARRILEAVEAGPGDGAPLDGAADLLVPALPRWRSFAAGLGSPWSAGLALVALARPPETAPLPALARLAPSVAVWSSAAPPGEAATSGDGQPVPPLAPLAALSPARRGALGAALQVADAEGPGLVEPVSIFTRFGGLLLLLPSLAELPLDLLFQDPCACAWARLQILGRCAGATRAARALGDPGVRRLCGLADDPTLSYADFMGMAPALLASRLAPLVAAPDDQAEPAETRAYFARPPSLEWPERADAVVVAAARRVLRRFAHRLPGFADSSPRYLYENFLDFGATLEQAGAGLTARTGRPPLAALLGLTGALRGEIRVPWLGTVTVREA